MKKETVVMTNFIKKTLERLEGDTNQAYAQRNERLAKAAISGQINALEGKITHQEIAVEEYEEKLNSSLYPCIKIDNARAYTQNITSAENELRVSKEDLEELVESKIYFDKLLKENF